MTDDMLVDKVTTDDVNDYGIADVLMAYSVTVTATMNLK